MPSLPAFDISTLTNHSPHIIILGAGASKATFPNGDENGKIIPVMNELSECLGIGQLLKESNISSENNDFESLYSDLALSGEHPKLVKEIETLMWNYFSDFSLPDHATIYDYLVLSLRDQDLIASFNWDPFLALAYQRNAKVAKLPQMAFLHGNVEIAICLKDRIKDFRGKKCGKCGETLDPTPLLYPIGQKDYAAHPFIEAEWNLLRHFLKNNYFLTIFGYAAPQTDMEARKILSDTWKENPIFELAQISIIDIKSRQALDETWKEFFCRNHYGISDTIWNSYLFRHPRRSCEALAMATLQNMPWEDNPFPQTEDLRKLQKWAHLLWLEERTGRLSGNPISFS